MVISSLQISEADRVKLEKQERGMYTFNILARELRTLTGLERENRRVIRAYPRTGDDQALTELGNSLLDWGFDVSNYDIQMSKAYLDSLIGGIGWLRSSWSWAKDPLGLLDIQRINPFGVRMDLDVDDPMLSDCKYILHSLWMPIEKIIQTWAYNDPELIDILYEESLSYLNGAGVKRKFIFNMWERVRSFATGIVSRTSFDSIYNNSNSNIFFNPTNGLFKTITAHHKQTEIKTYHQATTGNVTDITEMIRDNTARGYDQNKLAHIREQLGLGIVKRTIVEEIYATTIVPAFPGLILQNKPYPIQTGNFLYTPLICYDLHPDMSLVQSVVDDLTPAQENLNKLNNIIIELATRNASRNNYIYKPSAVKDFEEDWTNPTLTGSKRMAESAKWNEDIIPEQAPPIPTDLWRMQDYSLRMVSEISGISPAARGQKESSNESGDLAVHRAERSDLNTSMINDNVNRARVQIGQNAIALMQKFLTGERVIRVTSDQGEKNITLNQYDAATGKFLNDPNATKYDIKISNEPSGRTAREMEYAKLTAAVGQIIQLRPEAGPKLVKVVIKASTIPYKEQILQALDEMDQPQQDPEELAAKQLQAEIAVQELRNRDLDADSKELDNALKVKNLMNQGIEIPPIDKQTY